MKLYSSIYLSIFLLLLTACQAEENKQSQPIQQRSELNYVSQNEDSKDIGNTQKLSVTEPTSKDIENIRIEIESIEEVKVAQVQVQQDKMYVGVSMHPEVDPLEADYVQGVIEALLDDISPNVDREVSVNASHLWQMRNLDGIGK
ncbi:hypothetical protein [Saliterribacillus persicus]|uniref:Sporulation lipoprotein YhcN/YlaJ n=1 Tax=Saliterribacillus persicus TaxID=930114 RepID=A0A368XEM0_9BACI|nr:hypothetical protein [Saliterribacillus persicus]RCW66421.1 hypothetical protein DFR57_109144 [Saliterribacillus persicus]